MGKGTDPLQCERRPSRGYSTEPDYPTMSGTSVEELQRLNPGLIRSTVPTDSTHSLLIPRTSEQHFRERLARLSADRRVRSVKYRVRWCDTLSTIAQNSRTTVTRLRQVNQLESVRIFAGKFLIVPLGEHDQNAGGSCRPPAMHLLPAVRRFTGGRLSRTGWCGVTYSLIIPC